MLLSARALLIGLGITSLLQPGTATAAPLPLVKQGLRAQAAAVRRLEKKLLAMNVPPSIIGKLASIFTDGKRRVLELSEVPEDEHRVSVTQSAELGGVVTRLRAESVMRPAETGSITSTPGLLVTAGGRTIENRIGTYADEVFVSIKTRKRHLVRDLRPTVEGLRRSDGSAVPAGSWLTSALHGHGRSYYLITPDRARPIRLAAAEHAELARTLDRLGGTSADGPAD